MLLHLPKVIGHRGAAGYAPENTLASFTAAKQCDSNWVEFDVQLTACATAVVFHDRHLSRTTNGKGFITYSNYNKIAALDAGSWFSDEFANEHIPTLLQVLEHLGRNNLNANIELKTTALVASQTVNAVLSLLAKAWPSHLAPPLLSSFCLTTLAALRKSQSPWPAGLLLARWQRNWPLLMSELGCISLHINHTALTLQRAAQIKNAGYYLLAYTVNDPERAKKLFAWGVDSVFSDFPDRIKIN